MKQMTLEQIGRTAHEINAANGWEVFAPYNWPHASLDEDAGEKVYHNEQDCVRFLCTHMALVHSEVSEATEAIRHRNRANFDEELADVVIRVASIAYGLGIDLEAAIWAKLQKNATRGLHHGGKAV